MSPPSPKIASLLNKATFPSNQNLSFKYWLKQQSIELESGKIMGRWRKKCIADDEGEKEWKS